LRCLANFTAITEITKKPRREIAFRIPFPKEQTLPLHRKKKYGSSQNRPKYGKNDRD
jgi:hypothetical protein